jgi:hypothetical protein
MKQNSLRAGFVVAALFAFSGAFRGSVTMDGIVPSQLWRPRRRRRRRPAITSTR